MKFRKKNLWKVEEIFRKFYKHVKSGEKSRKTAEFQNKVQERLKAKS